MFKFFWVGTDDNLHDLDEELQDDYAEKEVWQLALDILETPNEVIIVSPVAGIDLDDIDLSFKEAVLTIKWTRKKPEIFDSEVIIRNSECFWWEFVRNIILPENLDFDTIAATMENNLLIITIRKLTFSSQNIKINRTSI